ncbi:MAG TPA: hemerythrin family protein [Candidatus Acidoferrales bacterium]|jgi:hemerythrin-like metal-binding protein|nr:hemerythrin family protein [Candidatus Acidoferrales bacterium]
MAHFQWNDSNAVYLPELDAEHRSLFLIAGELHKALLARTPPERFLAVLRKLLAHTEGHFQHEERLMRAVDYPSYGWHRRQHDTVRKRVKLLAQRAAEGDSEAPMLLLEFLDGWLRDHTAFSDRMMASYLRNRERVRFRTAS